jgi:hypothetical protein
MGERGQRPLSIDFFLKFGENGKHRSGTVKSFGLLSPLPQQLTKNF